MKFNKLILMLVVGASLVLSGCTNKNLGAVVGTVVGGTIGNQFGDGRGRHIATIVGASMGMFVGAGIGESFDERDAANTHAALEKNRTGSSSSWVNPDSGNAYSITPTKTYQAASGRYCREYQTTVTVGGKSQDAYGTACRQPDGDWEII